MDQRNDYLSLCATYDVQKVEMQITVQSLALEFSHALRSELSAEEMRVVIQRNRAQLSPNICHSHDFCDANMVLHAVFLQHGMDAADEGGMDRWGELWDQAWNMAKAEEFLISDHASTTLAGCKRAAQNPPSQEC